MQDLCARILNYFAESGVKAIRPKELAYELKVGKKDFSEFKAAVEQLLGSGRMTVGKNKQLRVSADPALLRGTIKRSKRGFGYFRPSDPTLLEVDESLYIAPEDLRDAFTGDEVQVQLLKRRMKGKRCGRVIEVLSRASTTFVGTYFEKRNFGFVRIEGGQFESAISVGDPGAKGARPEDQVVVEILRFPSPTDAGEAVITNVLGPRGTAGVDLMTIIHEFGLPDEFPEAVLAEARLQAQKFAREVEETSNESRVMSDEVEEGTDETESDDEGFPSLGPQPSALSPTSNEDREETSNEVEEGTDETESNDDEFPSLGPQPSALSPAPNEDREETSNEVEVGAEETESNDDEFPSISPQPSPLNPSTSRVDLTNETIITIDPVDARDFDDAISLKRESDGNWRLGVHIADVAYFVRPGTMLDKEARNRGTSVYLPDKVLPMLPELISNALASLQQGKVRYTKSAFITFNSEGTPLHAEFANTKIKVTQRFAYEQVMPLLGVKRQAPSVDLMTEKKTEKEKKGRDEERLTRFEEYVDDDDDSWMLPGNEQPWGTGRRGRRESSASVPSGRSEAPVEAINESTIQSETSAVAETVDHHSLVPHADNSNGGIVGRNEQERSDIPEAMIEGQETDLPATQQVAPKVLALLHNMYELAMILRKRRFARGALDLALPEVKIDMDLSGKVNGAHVVSHDESHQIIEEFMLAANIAVATKLADCGINFLRRSHAPPDERKLRALSEFVASLGYKVRPMPGRGDLQKLLKEVHGTPREYSVSYAVLRSTKRAEYNPDPDTGHYALSEANYCHFTSPIRRYPDLTIHRLLDDVIRRELGEQDSESRKQKKSKPDHSEPPADLVSLGKWCSETERRADDAEKELIKLKMLEYLSDRIGEEFDATITGVEKFGLFCMGVQLPAEGMIHVSNLPDDNYDYDDRAHTLVGRRSGRVFRLGGSVRVVVAAVDLVNRNLEYRLVSRGRKPEEKTSDRRPEQRNNDRDRPRKHKRR